MGLHCQCWLDGVKYQLALEIDGRRTVADADTLR